MAEILTEAAEKTPVNLSLKFNGSVTFRQPCYWIIWNKSGYLFKNRSIVLSNWCQMLSPLPYLTNSYLHVKLHRTIWADLKIQSIRCFIHPNLAAPILSRNREKSWDESGTGAQATWHQPKMMRLPKTSLPWPQGTGQKTAQDSMFSPQVRRQHWLETLNKVISSLKQTLDRTLKLFYRT